MKREEVYQLIDEEREYQDLLWPQRDNPDSPNALTIGEFVLLISEYVDRAKNTWAKERKPEIKTLHMVRKIAGIAVNCMEQHGAPQRIADEETEVLEDLELGERLQATKE